MYEKEEKKYIRLSRWESKFQERGITQAKVQRCEEFLCTVNARHSGIIIVALWRMGESEGRQAEQQPGRSHG